VDEMIHQLDFRKWQWQIRWNVKMWC
jgi:hypothetical protein